MSDVDRITFPPGSFHSPASSSKQRFTPRAETEWEDEEQIEETFYRPSTPRRDEDTSSGGKSPRRAVPRTLRANGRGSPSTSTARSLTNANRTTLRRRDAPRRAATPALTPVHATITSPPQPRPDRHPNPLSVLRSTLSLLVSSLHVVLSIFNILLRPFLPYILYAFIIAFLILYLPPRIPWLLLKAIGWLLHSVSSNWLDSLSYPSLLHVDTDIALARGLTLLPIRSLATPACALIGLGCQFSLLSRTSGGGTLMRVAQPFWKARGDGPVDIAGVARNLTKDVKGAKDIFESISLLSEGGMMDRLEYVRIWELGAAVAVGSNLESKDMVAQQLIETKLGDDSRDLSDELVDINALAVNAFTWVQWEFAGLVKTLSLPPSRRPTPSALAGMLNSQLNRLHGKLGELHHAASRANQVASRGSEKGRQVSNHLRSVGANLAREHHLQPGWKHAVDRTSHFFVGGELSKSELLSRDLAITEIAINSLNDLVHGLEHSRSSIKGFRDQIGYFDASMMGFHLGASEASGIGPEEEVRVLGEVVEEFGRAIGRAKERGLPESEAVRATRIEGR